MPSKTQQKCSICQEVGHNRRTCLQAAPHKSKKVKKVKRPVIDLTVDLTREAEPEEEQECCICMEKMQNVNCCTTRCGHKFCLTCFVRHSKGDIYAKCPLCRTTITDAPEPPPPPPPPPIDDEMSDDDILALDDDLDFLHTLSFLRSLINPVATREEREHALQQVWHT